MLAQTYRTITGREISLLELSPAERQFLARVREKYETAPTWTGFASWWLEEFQRSGLPITSVAYRISDDLEGRLGIAEGRVAHPDYRDYLLDLIEEKYGSRYEFCKQTGVDPGQLSRVFASKADLSLPHLSELLRKLDATLAVETVDAHAERIRAEGAAEALASVGR
jgi:hypothetical protein